MIYKISIVIPAFNEEENILPIAGMIADVFEKLPGYDYEIIFVDDGSNDATSDILKSLSAGKQNIFYINFSANFGKDNALIAGLRYVTGDAAITIDADLQHPIAFIPEFIEWWQKGFDVVYTYRNEKNKHAGFSSRIASRLFYNTINSFSDVQMEDGISDFKLIDKKVVNVINNLPEDRPFLRGLIKWVGFRQKAIGYEAEERYAGSTKYNKMKLLKLAVQGLTSFTTKPLSFAIYLGFFFSATSLLYIPYVLLSLYFHLARSGWASVIVTIAFFGGLQLMILGIIGLYLGKTFIQGKHRPRYIIKSTNLDIKL